MNKQKLRENSIARLQQKFPRWTRRQCGAQADKLIREVLSNRQPTNEDEFKAKIKKQAGLK